SFSLPDKHELKASLVKGETVHLPWAKHAKWALQAVPEKAALIGAGMAAMGVADARTLPVIHRLLPKDRIPPSLTLPETGKIRTYRLQQLEVDEDFTITGMLPEPDLSPDVPEAFLIKEKSRLKD